MAKSLYLHKSTSRAPEFKSLTRDKIKGACSTVQGLEFKSLTRDKIKEPEFKPWQGF
jgi:hypothetical protein